MPYHLAAFYQFMGLKSLPSLQAILQDLCLSQHITGSILLAAEGINGTVASLDLSSLQAFVEALKKLLSDWRVAVPASESEHFELKYSQAKSGIIPFKKTKILLKKEIVALGLPEIDPVHCSGQYLSPEEWDVLLQDPDALIIDARNEYEIQQGTFEKALNPKTRSFKEFPEFVQRQLDPKKNQKIGLFCTGGIRCEKAAAYMKSVGFESVYQLQGGILRYLAETPENHPHWSGDCFIFDDRGTVDRCVL